MPSIELDPFLKTPIHRQIVETGVFMLEQGLAKIEDLTAELLRTSIVASRPKYQQEIIAMIAANRCRAVAQDIRDIESLENALPFYNIGDYGR